MRKTHAAQKRWAAHNRQRRYRAIEAENDRRVAVIVGAATRIVRGGAAAAAANPQPASAIDKARAAASALRSATG